MSTSVKTESVEETQALGRRLGAALEVGDVIGLEGDLGTGKTELVKGIAEALGVTAGVHSPTFVLHHQYKGRGSGAATTSRCWRASRHWSSEPAGGRTTWRRWPRRGAPARSPACASASH